MERAEAATYTANILSKISHITVKIDYVDNKILVDTLYLLKNAEDRRLRIGTAVLQDMYHPYRGYMHHNSWQIALQKEEHLVNGYGPQVVEISHAPCIVYNV